VAFLSVGCKINDFNFSAPPNSSKSIGSEDYSADEKGISKYSF
jgi:hypothetical protein